MVEQTTQRTTSRARAIRHDCHGEECASGSRNNYYLGKHLTPDSYSNEQSYSIVRRRLINRAVLGWGVVYGFALSDARQHGRGGELDIGEGLAFDLGGRELIQTHETTVSIDNLLVLDGGIPKRADGDLNGRFEGLKCGADDCWLLSAHYAEKRIGHVTIKDPCRCDREEWDRICETIVYSLKLIKCDECCKPFECDLHCCCPSSHCCSEKDRELEECSERASKLHEEYADRRREYEEGSPAELARVEEEYEKRLDEEAEKRREIEGRRHARGGCSCICEHLTGIELSAECVRMTDVDDCTHADLGNGVALACVKLVKDECEKWSIGEIVDACGPRRLVKPNDLLFDLINGCDVTRIDGVGWWKWHRREQPVPFNRFLKALGGDGDVDQEEVPTEDFWVHFSRPVRADTLTRDVFTMAVMSDQTEGCWREYYRVPIVAVDCDGREKGDPPGTARRARIVVNGGWLSDGVMGRGSVFWHGDTHIEIEVRGDLIEDCLGQTVDANARGRSPFPTGSDGPGDTYISTFTVCRRPREPEPEPRQGYRSRRRTAEAA